MADAPDGADPLTGGASLRKLGQSLDAWPAPWARRISNAWRARRPPAVWQVPERFASLTRGGAGSTDELVVALSFALRAGAAQSAIALAERLAQSLTSLTGATSRRATALVVESLILQGERAKARELAAAHASSLIASPEGVSLLELLEVGEPRLWLPDGRLNLLACTRRGSWCADELAALLLRRPWSWVRQPELNLLFFSLLRATDSRRALTFLNRFLAGHGLESCSKHAVASDDDVLAGLHFDVRQAPPTGPLVSVLVAARNAARTVVYAIESLLAQSYPALEILVGDDASDDSTAAVLHHRYAGNPRVRLFRSTTQQGAYNVRNALVARALGALLAFHDADDLALPSRIARQVARLSRPGAVGCVTSWLRITPAGQCVFFKDQKARRLSQVSLMLTRAAFDEVGPFRSARIGADRELFAKLRARYGEKALSRIAAPLIFGLWGRSSATRTPGAEALEDGYLSPARRQYAELVFAQHAAGFAARSSEELDQVLRAGGNYLEPSELFEIT